MSSLLGRQFFTILGTRNERCEVGRQQINVRLSDDLVAAIDERRIALRDSDAGIPSRSDVVRLALEAYLGVKVCDGGAHEDGPEARTQKKG
ncbi:hypothetical protein CKO25_19475 [Thiocapsa imhoffii]|uniref:Ribbon-helix-helix protein CopG domain-containing protein n=1 Tax=Thiocapsa imhoffii TaxID=382777 RepID=A0A9X0WLE6_9GAMM|nr:ribbon-helix-helix domain-containing protein [Thiocapsa imhoffii]MBK1646778.1 hypothetical protein [Thiocapsa imhoffii]